MVQILVAVASASACASCTHKNVFFMNLDMAHSKITDLFQSRCICAVSKIPETILKIQSGILHTYFQEYINYKQLRPFKASENHFYIPKN